MRATIGRAAPRLNATCCRYRDPPESASRYGIGRGLARPQSNLRRPADSDATDEHTRRLRRRPNRPRARRASARVRMITRTEKIVLLASPPVIRSLSTALPLLLVIASAAPARAGDSAAPARAGAAPPPAAGAATSAGGDASGGAGAAAPASDAAGAASPASDAAPITVVVQGAAPPRSASESVRGQAEIRAAPHRTASDVLQLVPGVFTSQHSGECKAHQIFFRGFDAVHGQDLEIGSRARRSTRSPTSTARAIPTSISLMPEVIRELRAQPGSYDPRQGDFAVAGTMRFDLAYGEPGITATASAGSFGARRLFLAYPRERGRRHVRGLQRTGPTASGPPAPPAGPRSSRRPSTGRSPASRRG